MDTASAGGEQPAQKRRAHKAGAAAGRTRWIGETSIRGVFAGDVKEHFAVRPDVVAALEVFVVLLHDASDVRVPERRN